MKVKALCVVGLLVAASAALAAGYNSNGFEPTTFVTGPLNGQDGWVGTGAGGGFEPAVVTSPDPVEGTQAVKLSVPNTQGAASTMHMGIAPVTPGPGVVVTVSYDVYRHQNDLGKTQNLWWWWVDAGTPTYGLQWDIGGTLPAGWNPGAGSATTIYDAWTNITQEWDFGTGIYKSWYNGVAVDTNVAITEITTLTGWEISLAHDAGTEAGEDTAWIDNFSITVVPEPAALMLLGLGALLRRR
jgi:hypothetical protein